MDVDTINLCWGIFQRYIKSSDHGHAVTHLVTELLDAGLHDEDIRELAGIDVHFAEAVKDNSDEYDEHTEYNEDDDSWD